MTSRAEELVEWLRFLRAESHLLSELPWLVWQQGANGPDGPVAWRARELLEADRWPPRSWLRLLNREGSSGLLMKIPVRPAPPPVALAVTPDGRRILSGGWQEIEVWDALSGRKVGALSGHSGKVSWISATPDSTRAISWGEDAVLLWDLKGSREIGRFHVDAWPIAVLPGARILAAAETSVLVLNFEGGSVTVLREFDDKIRDAAATPDGERLAVLTHDSAASGDRLIVAWARDIGDPVVFPAAGYPPIGITSDGRFAFSQASNGTICIWDVDSGRQLGLLAAHTRATEWDPHVNVLAVASHGRVFASGGNDKIVQVWRVAGGPPVATFEGHTRPIWALAFFPDGSRLVSASYEPPMCVWDLPNL